MVAVSISTSDGFGQAVLEVSSDGSTWVNVTGTLSGDNGKRGSLIVPIGGYYRLMDTYTNSGFTGIARWVELR